MNDLVYTMFFEKLVDEFAIANIAGDQPKIVMIVIPRDIPPFHVGGIKVIEIVQADDFFFPLD